ncbi:2'-5' RNA ligase [Cupriavidus gilardii J11]|uniref:RNA 2',3'-cyclic phosphodiesterase n=1 Tax=Cupriavidus gilardii J11 TaxID=936133 RepID=A0A562BQ03_9BURK|nr:RNA 2',3'-cyclic phosphodiesterase [Cupriavidus gilardii]TWG87212.1 2'-5' RNA ligase [Cupriavidus gilardii J11]
MVRLFVAMETPASDAAALLATLPRGRAIRPTPAAQVHMTLRFIGEVSDEHARRIEAALAGLTTARFAMRLAGAGRFGRGGGVLWAGVEAPPALGELQRAIEAAVVATGVAPEPRPFHPHVTVARCRPGVSDAMLRDWTDRQRDWRGAPFTVERFLLMESRLLAGGAEHRCRRSFPLSQGRNPT